MVEWIFVLKFESWKVSYEKIGVKIFLSCNWEIFELVRVFLSYRDEVNRFLVEIWDKVGDVV